MTIDTNLFISRSATLRAKKTRVWEVLTHPDLIKQYLFGAKTVTDWQVGNPIVFQGEVQGQVWQDKGTILENVPGERISYSYWSGYCGLEDVPENYGTVVYTLDEVAEGTVLNVTQRGYVDEKSRDSSDAGWKQVLDQIKKIAEN